MSNGVLRARLFGTPVFAFAGETLAPGTRKATAMLAVLALTPEGVDRTTLAELLWGAGQTKNVRVELHRLRKLPGADRWLEVGPRLQLAPASESDVGSFAQLVAHGRYQEALELYAGEVELLAGLEPRAAPAFLDWRERERRRVEAWLRDALRGAAHEAARQGDLTAALTHVRQLLARDLLDEEAHREVMRWELERGNLPAARRQFEACRRLLAEELGVEPTPATRELAVVIERAAASAAPRSASTTASTTASIMASTTALTTAVRMPPALLRPPWLVRRERERERLEAARQRGQTVFLSGPAGIGKTRLMEEFVRDRGPAFSSEGRPGDSEVPGSTLARSYRRIFTANPELLEALAPWQRHEFARLLPDLFDEQPEPITSERLHVRFETALAAFAKDLGERYAFSLVDDLHFYDPLSFALAGRITAQRIRLAAGAAPTVQTICCYRPDELPPGFLQVVRRHVEAGMAIVIELDPFDGPAVVAFLQSLALPEIGDGSAVAAELYRLSGGNPQFLVELLKALFERGWRGGALPEALELPERIEATIRRRLERLSEDALQVAQAMAVARSQKASTRELAALLERSPLDVAAALGELEQAQMVRDGGFVHDLLSDAVREATPAAVQRALHAQVAGYLERQAAEPARIASHWLAADEPSRVLPWRLRAAEELLAQGDVEQARAWLEEVVAALPRSSAMAARARNLLERLDPA